MKTEPEMRKIELGRRCIPYALHRTARKNLRVVVNPDLSVAVYAPRHVETAEIESGMARKAAWIAKTLDRVETYHPLPSPKQYISGETFVYLGRQYLLKVVNGESGATKLSGRYLRVSVSDCENGEAVKRRVDRWYRGHAKNTFERYLARCYEVASRHGVPEPTICVRKMRRRWGSCAVSGRITLNIGLVQVPVHCIEYVIMHELCHLRHHNHSPNFYRLLTRCQPDWRNRKDTLDRFRLA
jgi:hypothetical protein